MEVHFETERAAFQEEILNLKGRMSTTVMAHGTPPPPEGSTDPSPGSPLFAGWAIPDELFCDCINIGGGGGCRGPEYKETVTEKIYLQEQSKEAEVRLAMSHRRVSEVRRGWNSPTFPWLGATARRLLSRFYLCPPPPMLLVPPRAVGPPLLFA